MRAGLLALVLASLVALSLLACGGGNGNGGGNAGSSAGHAGSASGNAGSGGVGGDGGVDCHTASDCATCCDEHFPGGVSFLVKKLHDCSCAACAVECESSLCDAANPRPPPSGGACDTCSRAALGTQTDSDCSLGVARACQGDTTCTTYMSCLDSCP